MTSNSQQVRGPRKAVTQQRRIEQCQERVKKGWDELKYAHCPDKGMPRNDSKPAAKKLTFKIERIKRNINKAARKANRRLVRAGQDMRTMSSSRVDVRELQRSTDVSLSVEFYDLL